MKKMLLIALSVAVLSWSAAAAAEVALLVAHGAPEDHSSHLSWLKFKEEVEKNSNGTMSVDIYPNQQMGGDREVVEAAQLGNVHLGHSSLSPVASFAREFYIWDTPFHFTSRDQIYSLLDGEPGKQLLACLEPVNLKGLGFTENGFRNLTANKSVTSPDDLRGVKIRVMENKLQMLTWSSLGANPTPIAFGELFTALQQKTVDAQENPFELIYTNKLHEVQSHIMNTNHIYSPMVVFMNLEMWDSLTPAQQDIVQKATDVAVAYNREIAKANETKALDEIKKVCTYVELNDAQRQSFRDKMTEVYKEIRSQVANDKLADMFLK